MVILFYKDVIPGTFITLKGTVFRALLNVNCLLYRSNKNVGIHRVNGSYEEV